MSGVRSKESELNMVKIDKEIQQDYMDILSGLY